MTTTDTSSKPILFTKEIVVRQEDPRRAADLLAHHTKLPKLRIKDAMAKGAVWHARQNRNPARMRRATAELAVGDRIAIYYNSEVLASTPPQVRCLYDFTRYSVWYKPAGLLVEGSRFGDHATLLRQVELHFGQKRQVYLVHRLDREAAGLILIAHRPQAAARLSALFQERQISKEYHIAVRGDLRKHGATGRIEAPLDGKSALTDYKVLEYLPEEDRTNVQVFIHTGRYHQIRRHFEGIGYPVLGDPKYGRNNADPEGMRLRAVGLRFRCPWTGEWVELREPEDKP